MNFKNFAGILLSLFVIFLSCENTDEELRKLSFSGFVQKGPFITGSEVQLFPLKSDLTETGNIFTAKMADDFGSFTFSSIELSENYAKLSADGYYFNEVAGELSASRLVLNAVVDINDKENININVLTHLSHGRILFLVQQGVDFGTAKQQAEEEVFKIFSYEKGENSFEDLDILKTGDENSRLLAIASILQGYWTTAELSEILAKISIDIETDGTLDDTDLQIKLMNQANLLKCNEIISNLNTQYTAENVSVNFDALSNTVNYFISNCGYINTNPIEYPEKYNSLTNLLFSDETEYLEGEYCLAANLQKGSSLKILLLSEDIENNPFGIISYDNWELKNDYPKSFEFTTLGNNETEQIEILTDACTLPSVIEVYENDAIEPSWTKNITFIKDTMVFIPQSGNYGENLLALPYSNSLPKGTYSIACEIKDWNRHTVEITISGDQSKISFGRNENWTINEISESEVKLTFAGSLSFADIEITFSTQDMVDITGKINDKESPFLSKKIYFQ